MITHLQNANIWIVIREEQSLKKFIRYRRAQVPKCTLGLLSALKSYTRPIIYEHVREFILAFSFCIFFYIFEDSWL